MDGIYEKRIAVYDAAVKYHGALSEYFRAAHPNNQSQGRKEAADNSRLAALSYRAALTALLDYMLSAGALESTAAEAQEVKRHIELLDIETNGIRDE